MSIKDIIKGLAAKGKLTEEVTIQGSVFVLRTISTEEQFLVETIASMADIKKKFNAEAEINTYMDTIAKMRNVSLLAFVIESIDGVPTVDVEASPPEKFQQHVAFKSELTTLAPAMIDALIKGHNKLTEKNQELYKDIKGNLGK